MIRLATLAATALFLSAGPTWAGQATAPALGWAPADTRYPGAIRVAVDARDVERGVFRVTQEIPVAEPGPLTLLYPKWVPGNHAPTARIERMAGLTIRAGDQRLTWTRDPVDMHAFHVEVPAGVDRLLVEFQYLSATSGDQGRVVATPEMANLQWFSLVMYPAGYAARGIEVAPEVQLPEDWSLSTQMETRRRDGATTVFQPLDLEALLDAPIFAGRHFRRYELGEIGGAPVHLDVVADAPGFLDADPAVLARHRDMVRQTGLMFGPPPFEDYRFLLALTDEMGGVATEHLASSEITRAPDYLTNCCWTPLLAHELVHAWNGKARRPADLWSADFNQPMRTSMLWVYEGQTQFWAFVLSARGGLMTRDQVVDVFARLAAIHLEQPGRRWRPLSDTSDDLIISRELVEMPWPSWHREGNDSYTEANLVWLEIDGLLRELSDERVGLDDFAKAFFAGGGARPSLYDDDELVAALNRLQPYDWAGFLDQRLNRVAPEAPSDWLSRSGYRLVFEETPSEAFAAHQARQGRVELRHSLGMVLSTGSIGKVKEVIWGGPAFEAGLTDGAEVLAVNGATYSAEALEAAMWANRAGRAPIRLDVRHRGRDRTVTIDYRGGPRYPRLEREPGTPDRLGALLTPRV